MNKIENMNVQEDVEAGTKQQTVTILLKAQMKRSDTSVSFDYNVDIDDVGQIVLTPINEEVSFVEIFRLNEDESVDSIETETEKTFVVRLTADMISEDDTFDYFLDIDEIGQGVITPDSEKTSFLTVAVNDSLNLVTEQNITEALDPSSDQFIDLKEEVDELTVTIDEKLGEVIECLETIKDHFRTMGIHYLDIDGYFINYLEGFRSEDAGDMSIGELRSRIVEYEEEYNPEDLDESLTEATTDDAGLTEEQRLDIINRFTRGEITLDTVSDKPEGKDFIELTELTCEEGTSVCRYFYNTDSDAIACWCE